MIAIRLDQKTKHTKREMYEFQKDTIHDAPILIYINWSMGNNDVMSALTVLS